MRLLFVHQNFPGQYVHLARHYAADKANEVVAIADSVNKRSDLMRTIRYSLPGKSARRTSDMAGTFVDHLARAEAVAVEAEKLRQKGFDPDVILGHFGWGETLFLKDVWPRAKLLVYAEFFYGNGDADSNFDPEFQVDALRVRMRNRGRNGSLALALVSADRALAPTQWQRRQFPSELQQKIEVIHDGIDTDKIAPDPSARVTLKRQGVVLRPGDEVVTFVSRNLEPYRGYHVFMRALPKILAERPRARAIIVGGDDVSYGPRPAKGRKWRNVFLQEVKERLDLSRIHLVGKVPYDVYRQILQVSSAHVYLTYPFVLSWSMLEAMAAGCLVIGSDTAPVREVIRHEQNGLLVDFFNPQGLADCVVGALADPNRYHGIREAARRTILERFDLRRVCLPRQTRLIERLARE
jgi:glycosyltransferase involved in cell wall biosynthesis